MKTLTLILIAVVSFSIAAQKSSAEPLNTGFGEFHRDKDKEKHKKTYQDFDTSTTVTPKFTGKTWQTADKPATATGTTTVNTPNGQTVHNFTNTWNPTTDTGTHSSSTTYANGKTTESAGVFTVPVKGDYAYKGVYITAGGTVDDVSQTSDKTATGRTIDTTVYNTATGKTSTLDQTITNSSNGKTDTAVFTGPNGKAISDVQTVSYSDVSGTPTKVDDSVITGPNGKTTTADTTSTWVNDGNQSHSLTTNTTVTGPNGGVATDTNTQLISRTGNTVVNAGSNTFTGPAGHQTTVDDSGTTSVTKTPNGVDVTGTENYTTIPASY